MTEFSPISNYSAFVEAELAQQTPSLEFMEAIHKLKLCYESAPCFQNESCDKNDPNEKTSKRSDEAKLQNKEKEILESVSMLLSMFKVLNSPLVTTAENPEKRAKARLRFGVTTVMHDTINLLIPNINNLIHCSMEGADRNTHHQIERRGFLGELISKLENVRQHIDDYKAHGLRDLDRTLN